MDENVHVCTLRYTRMHSHARTHTHTHTHTHTYSMCKLMDVM